MKYRALVGLTIPVDEAEANRLREARLLGRPIPHSDRKLYRVEAGDEVAYLPDESREWLLAGNWIEPIEEPEGGDDDEV